MTGLYWRWDRETGIVSPTDLAGYQQEYEKDRRVAEWEQDGVRVSTVFLSLNHNHSRGGMPLVFETLVFGGPLDGEMTRYSTLVHARAGHKAMVARVAAAMGDAGRPNVDRNVILPAVPVQGIALRDFFAAHCLSGYLCDGGFGGTSYDKIAGCCYAMADAMLAQLEKKA